MNNKLNIERGTKENLKLGTIFKERMVGYFPRIEVGNYKISAQGSERSYSTPRSVFKNLTDYSAVEIAIFSKKGDWINPHKSSVFKAFPRWNELNFEDSSLPVCGWVDLELLSELIDYLENR